MYQRFFESQQIFHSQSYLCLVALVFYPLGGSMHGKWENRIADELWDFWILEIYIGDYIRFFQKFCQYCRVKVLGNQNFVEVFKLMTSQLMSSYRKTSIAKEKKAPEFPL